MLLTLIIKVLLLNHLFFDAFEIMNLVEGPLLVHLPIFQNNQFLARSYGVQSMGYSHCHPIFGYFV